jgi:hypothetical protein
MNKNTPPRNFTSRQDHIQIRALCEGSEHDRRHRPDFDSVCYATGAFWLVRKLRICDLRLAKTLVSDFL